jgi:hypothetical protein
MVLGVEAEGEGEPGRRERHDDVGGQRDELLLPTGQIDQSFLELVRSDSQFGAP